MKFAHLSDCHIGGWREEKLTRLNLETFRKSMEICIEKNVGFILIAGDLFNTSMPSIDLLKEVASILEKIRSHDISVYIIPGSHDYSPSGKTMLDVLEKAGLVVNVVKLKNVNDQLKLEFTTDKTGTKITGLFGKKGGLETSYYDILIRDNLENEPGFKIFMFHTALSEFRPLGMEMVDLQSYLSLPKNFDYYAGGHPHFIFNKKIENYGLLAYPGALYPNNFKELEEFKYGGFYIVDDKLNLDHIKIKIKEVDSYYFNADNKSALELEEEILNAITNYNDKIITIRIEGTLKSGKPSDIDFEKIYSNFNDAYIILRNTNKLTSLEFAYNEVKSGNVEEVEDLIIVENLSGLYNLPKEEKNMIYDLMSMLYKEKNEGETNKEFDLRVIEDCKKILQL